ncbi:MULTISPECIES: hypothetical protein [unclassified Nostoc]|nr:hypothetical protein [Nostoc sp. 'Peltigera membranacea cyanobiont' 232]
MKSLKLIDECEYKNLTPKGRQKVCAFGFLDKDPARLSINKVGDKS